jgi:hypothetical protein
MQTGVEARGNIPLSLCTPQTPITPRACAMLEERNSKSVSPHIASQTFLVRSFPLFFYIISSSLAFNLSDFGQRVYDHLVDYAKEVYLTFENDTLLLGNPELPVPAYLAISSHSTPCG